jgi:hypothetical protein
MNAKFARFVDSLEPKFQALVRMKPVCVEQLPSVVPKQGIYLFSDGRKHLYVGRSDNIRRRLRLHCRASSQHNQATFAFRMARHETGQTRASYSVAGSRQVMAKDRVFGPAFVSCKARIRTLDLRFVEEVDATRQALLEIYAATVLQTPFNDFKNH